MTVLLGLLASVFYGLSDFLGGTLSRSVSPFRVLIVAQVIATVAIAPSVALSPNAAIPVDALQWGAIAGVANAIALSSLYMALAHGTMGVVAPISAASVVVPVVAGLFAGEAIGALTVVGIFLLIAGTVLAAGPEGGDRNGNPAGRRAIALSVLAAAGFGIAVLALAKGSVASVSVTLLTSNAVSAALFVAVSLVTRKKLWLRGKPLVGALLVGILGLAANWLFGTAASGGTIVVVAVLASLYPVVTALLARYIHRERLRPVQLVGVCAVLVGIAVVVAA